MFAPIGEKHSIDFVVRMATELTCAAEGGADEVPTVDEVDSCTVSLFVSDNGPAIPSVPTTMALVAAPTDQAR